MAKIFKSAGQLEALARIQSVLKELEGINQLLENSSSEPWRITVSNGKLKTRIQPGDGEAVGFLRGKQTDYIREIRLLADKYSIGLNDDEKRILEAAGKVPGKDRMPDGHGKENS